MQETRRVAPRTGTSSSAQLQAYANGQVLVMNSAKMRIVLATIDKVADSDISVLIRGESGTGKELVARTLQARSSRRNKPFVKVNCAAMPEMLLESELFGYEQGAFTGAVSRKPGKFEIANTGTIFLDEIGDLQLTLQAKLLQVLQDGKFPRLGGVTEVNVDVRVIASTHRDLGNALQEGKFRDDLFYRLNVVSIFLPPLRERREDLALLTEYFLDRYSRQYNKSYSHLADETIDLFMRYHWPGNVRELENLIKRVVILDDERSVVAMISHKLHSDSPGAGPDFPREHPRNLSLKDAKKMATQQVEKELIKKVLYQTRWNRKTAAKMLGIGYRTMLYKIQVHNLERPYTEE